MLHELSGAIRYNLYTLKDEWYRCRHGRLSERIFFLHIPKCGGTSVIRALNRKFRREDILALNPLASTEVSRTLNMNLMDFRENILMYSLATRRCRHVAGHYVWSDKAYQLYRQDWKFITILRHPVDKWLSQYYFNRYKDADHFQIDLDIESYLNSEEGKALGYDQSNKLSDVTITDPDDMLEAALINLDKFDVIGVVEHLDRFQQDFKNHFKSSIDIPHLNKNPAESRKQQASVNPEIREQVEALCKRDMRLYRATLDKLGLAHPATGSMATTYS